MHLTVLHLFLYLQQGFFILGASMRGTLALSSKLSVRLCLNEASQTQSRRIYDNSFFQDYQQLAELGLKREFAN